MSVEPRISRNVVQIGIETGTRNRNWFLVLTSAILSFLLVACDGYRVSSPSQQNVITVPECEPEQFDGALNENQAVLCQNWDAKQRLDFWFREQGSQIIPYDWFLALEQPGNEEAFTDNAHMDGFGYLPQRKTNKNNPDGLPIGFTKDRATGNEDYTNISDEWLGLTCAACHTNQIDFGSKQMVIDGAPSMGNLEELMSTLVDSMQKTLDNPAKFNRFADTVFELDNAEADSREELREQLEAITNIRQKWNDRNKGESPYGYARLDAIGAIFNEISFAAGGETISPTAPVSYPFIWDTPHHDKVQWNGSATNKGAGALGRNVGEVLGVFGSLEIKKKAPLGYKTSVRVKHLGKLENLLVKLQSPRWVDTYLPKIDTDSDQFKFGQRLFEEHCQSCHADIDRADETRCVAAVLTPLEEVSTDPAMTANFANWTSPSNILQGKPKGFISIPGSEKFGSTGTGIEFLKHAITGAIVKRASTAAIAILRGKPPGFCKRNKDNRVNVTLDMLMEDQRQAEAEIDVSKLVYKARPLNGIWATAPYLHNGSVPTLKNLLKKPEDRVSKFYVGSRRFDANEVGFKYKPEDFSDAEKKNLFLFDTTIEGNRNTGHEYPPEGLTQEEIDALVEYQKTL